MTDIYVLDTNIISALVNLSVPDMMTSPLIHRVQTHQQSSLIICECVLYEIERGLIHNQSKNKLSRFYTSILPDTHSFSRLEIGRGIMGIRTGEGQATQRHRFIGRIGCLAPEWGGGDR